MTKSEFGWCVAIEHMGVVFDQECTKNIFRGYELIPQHSITDKVFIDRSYPAVAPLARPSFFPFWWI